VSGPGELGLALKGISSILEESVERLGAHASRPVRGRLVGRSGCGARLHWASMTR
jgi:hypothetical protein